MTATADLLGDGVTPGVPGALSDRGILAAYESGELGIDPFDADLVRPAALGLRLGSTAAVLVPPDGPIDLAVAASHPRLVPREPDEHGRLRLDPGEIMLAPTLERISLSPGLTGLMGGTSSCARLGVSVALSHHVSPGYGHDHPGGAILTFEIECRLACTVFLRPGTRIGNLMLFRCSPALRPYWQMPANYSRDVTIRASRLAEHHVC
ncbi:MAG: dCTP deaminase [Candidatus Nanopelagicales bacterium]